MRLLMRFVQIAANMVASSGTSTNPPPLCCEHHGCQKKEEKGLHYHLDLPSLKEIKQKPIGVHCAAIFYILFALVCLIAAIAELILSISNTVLTKNLDSEASGRLIGTVILAICAAVASLTVIYSIFAICKKNCKAVRVVSTILAVLVIVQVLLVAFAVTVKKEDNRSLEASLTESWLQASKEREDTYIKLWDSMQSELKCCGLRGPEDYRDQENPYNPIKIPFSCCTSYHSNQTDFYMKWQRDLCILNKSYYEEGCIRIAAIEFKNTTRVTVGVSILVVVLEIIMVALGFYLGRKCSKKHKNETEAPSTSSEAQTKK